MKRSSWLYIVIALIISLLIIFVVVVVQNHKTDELDYCNVQSQIEYFDEIVVKIKDEFVYKEFDEIMDDKTHFMALPLEYTKINELGIILDMQKLFVYIDKETGTTIILQVTLNPYSDSTKSEWYSSIDYRPETFNSPDSYYGAYNSKTPCITIGANSFSYFGINYSTVVFTQHGVELEASEVMTSFSNALIEFITKK